MLPIYTVVLQKHSMNPNSTKNRSGWASNVSNKFSNLQGEFSSAFVLILLGVTGLYLMPKTAFQSSATTTNYRIGSYVQPTASAAITNANTNNHTNDATKQMTELVSVTGKGEAGQPVFFKVAHFNQSLQYRLKFDNGQSVSVNQPEFEYTFANAGQYGYILEVIYQGDTAVLDQSTIRIKDDWFASK